MSDIVTRELQHFLVVQIQSFNLTLAVPYNRPGGSTVEFMNDMVHLCLETPNCFLMGDLNYNLLNVRKRNEITNLFETRGFAILNDISEASLVHHPSSDHAIIFASINRKSKLPSYNYTKKKFLPELAIVKVDEMCRRNEVTEGDELNTKLEQIVSECTKTLTFSSNYRIKKSHVSRELIVAIRECSRLYNLHILHPDNEALTRLYEQKRLFVSSTNERLAAAYNANRISQAAGDARKTWTLYKEIVFNQHQQKHDKAITINGISTDSSTEWCNEIDERFCTAGEHLA